MQNRSFYRDLAQTGQSQQIDEEPLVVNCAGLCCFDTPFHTWNREGRADYYLQLVTCGTLAVWLGDQVQEMHAGDFLLTKPRTPYRYFYPATDLSWTNVTATDASGATAVSQDTPQEMQYYWVHFTGFHAGRLLTRLHLEPGMIYTTGAENSHAITALPHAFERLFDEFTDRRRGFDDACAAELTGILVSLSRAVSTGSHTTERTLSTIAWLHSHFLENTPLSTLAAMEHLSESRYRTVFHQQTGLSPSEYRIALRMQHACDLLLGSSQSISEISAACGYSDVLYFTRLFKRKIGMPPGMYRSRSQHLL